MHPRRQNHRHPAPLLSADARLSQYFLSSRCQGPVLGPPRRRGGNTPRGAGSAAVGEVSDEVLSSEDGANGSPSSEAAQVDQRRSSVAHRRTPTLLRSQKPVEFATTQLDEDIRKKLQSKLDPYQALQAQLWLETLCGQYPLWTCALCPDFDPTGSLNVPLSCHISLLFRRAVRGRGFAVGAQIGRATVQGHEPHQTRHDPPDKFSWCRFQGAGEHHPVSHGLQVSHPSHFQPKLLMSPPTMSLTTELVVCQLSGSWDCRNWISSTRKICTTDLTCPL